MAVHSYDKGESGIVHEVDASGDTAIAVKLRTGASNVWSVDGTGAVTASAAQTLSSTLSVTGQTTMNSDAVVIGNLTQSGADYAVTIKGAINHDGTGAGFFGTAPVTRTGAWTQTYTSSDKTISSYTADDETTDYSGINSDAGNGYFASLTDLNALRTAYENLRAHCEDIGKAVNSIIDDLQTYGLFQ